MANQKQIIVSSKQTQKNLIILPVKKMSIPVMEGLAAFLFAIFGAGFYSLCILASLKSSFQRTSHPKAGFFTPVPYGNGFTNAHHFCALTRMLMPWFQAKAGFSG